MTQGRHIYTCTAFKATSTSQATTQDTWFQKFYFQSICSGPTPGQGQDTSPIAGKWRAQPKTLLGGRVRGLWAVLDICALCSLTDLTDVLAVPTVFSSRSSAHKGPWASVIPATVTHMVSLVITALVLNGAQHRMLSLLFQFHLPPQLSRRDACLSTVFYPRTALERYDYTVLRHMESATKNTSILLTSCCLQG